MSLPNEQQQLKLVALAARFAATSRRWDPDGDILEELNDVVTSAESLKRINPTDEPLTEESLAVRLKHLDDITQKEPLKILEVKDTDSPSDQHLIKRSLTNLKHYGDQGRASPSTGFHFTKNSTESDVNIVGIWIAARVCWELGYAYPGHERYPLHSIINSLVEVARRAPEPQLFAPWPTRGHVPGAFNRRPIPPPLPPTLRPIRAFSRSASPIDGYTASDVSSRCPSPAERHDVSPVDAPSAANGGAASSNANGMPGDFDDCWEHVP